MLRKLTVCGEGEVVALDDFRAHGRVGAAVRHAPHLVGVFGRDATKPKVAHLEPQIVAQKQILAFDVAMEAVACVEVYDCARGINHEAQTKSPGQRQLLVLEVRAHVASLAQLRHD